MSDYPIRRARPADVSAITALVNAAYARFVPRMGRPAPMLANYEVLVRTGEVWIIAGQAGAPAALGLLVLEPRDATMMIENVAVHPDRQGIGLGGKLLDFAEAEARARRFPTLTLYTNEVMTENIAIYLKRGFEIVERRTEDGFHRVYMAKSLT
ncbi:MAG TPA: GNAT family N-acetyltransferase [Stellaceae bacterium]|nr:GNAT family N-acetyltransferase [Stellaceae bacterium]